MEFADWIDIAGNILENNRDGDIIKGGTATNIFIHPDDPQITRPPGVKLVAPAGEAWATGPRELGQAVVCDASASTDPTGQCAVVPLGLH